jgi:predicted naringenin-chalcone synthase
MTDMTEGSVRILGLGTAVPPNRMSQDEAVLLAHEVCCRNDADRKLLEVLYRKSGVRQRHTALPHRMALNWAPAAVPTGVAPVGALAEENDDPFDSYGDLGVDFGADETEAAPATAAPGKSLGPTTGQRMQYYRDTAPMVALSAVAEALEEAQTMAGEITHLVTVSCTGFFSPGLELILIDTLGLRRTVERVNVGFMGCHGAINGLRVARALAAGNPRNRVLLCAVELCSLHYAFAWDPDRVVGNAVFADGAAALVLGMGDAPAGGDGKTPVSIAATGSCLIPNSADAMSWTIGDHGFEMFLSSRVPDLIQAHLRPWFDEWLAEQGLRVEDIGSWALHPGGPRIVSAVEQCLGLPDTASAASREVLATYGNMSSPTILFVLDRLRHEGARMPCVALGFGPGLAAEAALFR